MSFNCMISGVGGQGTVLASKLIAAAAMSMGKSVRTTETIGMAQRGGSVVSHVRIGDEIHSPLIPLKKADVIIGFEPAEAARITPYLAENGLIIACNTPIKPVTDSLSGGGYNPDEIIEFLKRFNAVIIDGQKIISEIGAKFLNTALLGAAAESGALGFEPCVLLEILKKKIPERFLEMNLKAFNLGRKIYNEQK